jgi:methylenetetrahydrofolate reductase (NADH)
MVQTDVIARSKNSNLIRESLARHRFFWTIEFIPAVDKVLRNDLQRLGGIAELVLRDELLGGFAVTDRVVSERDPDPIAAASHLYDESTKQPLVHFSGKGREPSDLDDFLRRLTENGLENLLVITGDRLKDVSRFRQRARYLDSVSTIYVARRDVPRLLIAAAVNPFKYREEDAMAQYLKLGKKVAAGANFGITQIGFDMRKYEELLRWTRHRGYNLPIVANVLPLSAARARYIRQHRLAGVTISDSLLALLESEERTTADQGLAGVINRLALQIIGVRFLGYAGVQITGLHSIERLTLLKARIIELDRLCPSFGVWQQAWNRALTLPQGHLIETAPVSDGWHLGQQSSASRSRSNALKYHIMNRIHRAVFDSGTIARIFRGLMRGIRRRSIVDLYLTRLERAIKGPLFGCETCGMCRLAATQYVCPETCPKGLANGACGGTSENLCEFGDRECIHSVKYRVARDANAIDQLERLIIPAVPAVYRGTSSWPPYFRREAPKIHNLPVQRENAAAATFYEGP